MFWYKLVAFLKLFSLHYGHIDQKGDFCLEEEN